MKVEIGNMTLEIRKIPIKPTSFPLRVIPIWFTAEELHSKNKNFSLTRSEVRIQKSEFRVVKAALTGGNPGKEGAREGGNPKFTLNSPSNPCLNCKMQREKQETEQKATAERLKEQQGDFSRLLMFRIQSGV